MLNQEQQRIIIRNILNTYSKAIDLELLFWINGQSAEALKIKVKADKLDDTIIKLRDTNWSVWSGNATTIEQKIKKNNTNLQSAIRDIQNDIKIAERTVKAIGYIDDVISIAAGLLL